MFIKLEHKSAQRYDYCKRETVVKPAYSLSFNTVIKEIKDM